jgi:large subunit ribosomal protein L11
VEKASEQVRAAIVAGYVTVKQIREIAEAKMKDLNATDVEGAMQIILGSAKSCGIEVKG